MTTQSIIGVLLAGGRSSRMGGAGDKCLSLLGGQTLLARAIARAQAQVRELILNANGDAARFAPYGLPVIPDTIEGFAGPLAGILSALEWARRRHPECSHVASFATDTPFFPVDLVRQLRQAMDAKSALIAIASSGGRSHPVFGLWPVALAADLRQAMTRENIRKVGLWAARHGAAVAEFQTLPSDPFFNINRPQDLAEAEILLRRCSG